jgi:diguanylate cyclase (GGDEF)-like protein
MFLGLPRYAFRVIRPKSMNSMASHFRSLVERAAKIRADGPGPHFAIVFADESGRVRQLNSIAECLTGWRASEVCGALMRDVFGVIDARTSTTLDDAMARLGDADVTELSLEEALLLSRDKEILRIEATCIRLPAGHVLAFRDLGHAQRLARQLEYQASHDAVTGLVNRAEFLRRTETLVAHSAADGTSHAMVYLDVDQFKVVNDTSGHDAGDELLRQLATLLLPQLRDSDLLGRLGGDEFGLLLQDCTLRDAERLTMSLIDCIRQHAFRWKDSVHAVSASAGVAAIERGTSNAQRALACADTACFLAKERGRGRVQAYEHEDHDLARYRLEMGWVARIAAALGEDRFRLHFQPILHVHTADDEQHVEALLYLLDEGGERISPAIFIPAAERYNLMPAVDRWVIRQAFMRLTQQPDAGRLVLCINLSAMTLCDEEFPEYVRLQLAATGVAPHRICFEITETAAMANLPRTIAVIDKLKSLGCRFALDDFGQGLSSFGYLRNLRIDYLKIDGAFVRGIASDRVDRAMVTAINDVGHVMGVKTIAECVETEQVFEELRKIGVDYAQGYWIARPEPDCVVRDLSHRTRRDPATCKVEGTTLKLS